MIPLRIAARIALTVAALAGCGGESEGTSGAAGTGGAAAECAPPNRLVGDACREPGVQDDGCPAGTLGLGDGTCRPAGIPPEMCGEGFVHDGDVGCEPILPAEECPPGQMAVPGDTACRPVMPCAPGKWGDIAIDATTEHVDGSYAGGGSDGSAAKPWTTIGEAIAACAPGATVAVAAGSYAEDVLIQGKPVVLWGVCPDEVEVAGAMVTQSAVNVRYEASGTVLRGLAITGAAIGLLLSGSEQVLVDRVWLHDNGGRGIQIENVLGPTSCAVRGSLVEHNHEAGVLVGGSEATIEATVVRGTQPNAQELLGRGINIQQNTGSGAPSTVTVRTSVVEQNHEFGVNVSSSDATIEATVVRGTLPDARGFGGHGVHIWDPENAAASTATVRSSLVEQNRELGVRVFGAEATIEATIVRGTLPNAAGLIGRGIDIEDDFEEGGPASVTVRSSLVEQNHGGGVGVFGSDGIIEATVVRRTQPDGKDELGRGITIEHGFDSDAPSTATVRSSLVEQNHEAGVVVLGSEAAIEATVVRETLPDLQGLYGRGIDIENHPESGAPSTAAVRSSLVEQNHDVGVFVGASGVTIEATVVRGTMPDADGLSGGGIVIQYSPESGAPSTAAVRSSLVEQSHLFGVVAFSSNVTIEGCLVRATFSSSEARFGDGISAFSVGALSTLSVGATRIEDSARAGISSFGAFVALGESVVQCAAFDLEGEPFEGAAFTFEDRGGNTCGCPSADGECLLETVGIEPPTPVTPIE